MSGKCLLHILSLYLEFRYCCVFLLGYVLFIVYFPVFVLFIYLYVFPVFVYRLVKKVDQSTDPLTSVCCSSALD